MGRKKSYAPAPEPDTEDDAPIEETGNIPPMPERGPLGDLTPEVMAWYRVNDPAEYERRYVRPGHPKGPRGIQH